MPLKTLKKEWTGLYNKLVCCSFALLAARSMISIFITVTASPAMKLSAYVDSR